MGCIISANGYRMNLNPLVTETVEKLKEVVPLDAKSWVFLVFSDVLLKVFHRLQNHYLHYCDPLIIVHTDESHDGLGGV